MNNFDENKYLEQASDLLIQYIKFNDYKGAFLYINKILLNINNENVKIFAEKLIDYESKNNKDN